MFKKESNRASLLSSALVYTIGLFLIKGLGLIGTPIFTRLLPPSTYGIVNIFATWTMLFSTVFGLYTQASLAQAVFDYSGKQYDAYISSTLSLSCFSFVVGSIIYYFNLDLFAELLGFPRTIALLLMPSAFANFLFNYWQVKLIYEGKKFVYLFVSFCTSALAMGCSVVLVIRFSGFAEVSKIFGELLPIFLVGFVFLFFSLYRGRRIINFVAWKYCLTLCVPMIFTTLSNIFLSHTDRLMLQGMTGSYSVGLYSFACTVGETLNFVRLGISNAWIPWAFQRMREKNEEQLQVMTAFLTRILCVLCMGFIFVTPELVKIIAGEKYWSGIPIIAPIVSGVFFNSLTTFYSSRLIFANKNIWITFSTVFAVCTNVVLNAFFILKFSHMGAAFATMLSYLACLVFYGIIVKKVLPEAEIACKTFVIDGSVELLGLIIFFLLYSNPLLRWTIGVALGIYLILYFLKNKKLLINFR